MTEIWIDAQLSPSLALWINQSFKNIQAQSLRAIGLRDASDTVIFQRAKMQNVVIITKDSDFVRLLKHFGPPPKIIWITAGNTSNLRMREILGKYLLEVLHMLESGERLVEIEGN
jgi:predicted nuclease of predicted toxin-antitoxin system